MLRSEWHSRERASAQIRCQTRTLVTAALCPNGCATGTLQCETRSLASKGSSEHTIQRDDAMLKPIGRLGAAWNDVPQFPRRIAPETYWFSTCLPFEANGREVHNHNSCFLVCGDR